MNKALFDLVKTKTKDTGLEEKYLKAITEKLGGSVADDSTDNESIETTANLIAEIAKETQSEATRWANKAKEPKKPETTPKKDDDKGGEGGEGKGNPTEPNAELLKRLDELEKRLVESQKLTAAAERQAQIKEAQAKHQIPEWRMKGLVVPDDQSPDEYLAGIKQDLITEKLLPENLEGLKVPTEKSVSEAAEKLLESILPKEE